MARLTERQKAKIYTLRLEIDDLAKILLKNKELKDEYKQDEPDNIIYLMYAASASLEAIIEKEIR